MAHHRKDPGTALLDAALEQWRSADRQNACLSADSRQTILRTALEATPATTSTVDRPFPALFVPFRKLMLAGALPVVALTLLLGWAARPTIEPIPVASHGVPPVHVTKSGDEVIFLIANGHRPHAIYKSGAPDRFDAPPAFWTDDGSFRDRLDNGPDLVFYRID